MSVQPSDVTDLSASTGAGVSIDGAGGSFAAMIGTSLPTLTDWGGGWEEIPRPRRTALTEWRGSPARKGTVQLLWDGFPDGTSVQSDVDGLIAAYAPTGGPTDPPTFTVTGAWPIPSTIQWVCQGITFDEWIRNMDGSPVRVMLTMTLLEYVAPDTVITATNTGDSTVVSRSGTPGSENSGPGNGTITQQTGSENSGPGGAMAMPGTRSYTTVQGDTLSSIAARQLGSWQLADQIATLNNIRDPNNVPPGTVIQLP